MQCPLELMRQEVQESIEEKESQALSSTVHTARPPIPPKFTTEDSDLIRSDIYGEDIWDEDVWGEDIRGEDIWGAYSVLNDPANGALNQDEASFGLGIRQ